MGALLLELGRTTMAVRMGQSPSEALINSGSSVFISASGPNPLMVQPRPFHPGPTFGGVHFTRLNFSHGLQGPTDSAPITGLSGARVVPVRRVVAVPAGVNRSPSDPSGNPVGLIFSVLHLNPGHVTDERSTPASTEPRPGSYNVDQLPLPDGNQIPANILPVASELDPSTHGPFQYQESGRVFIPSRRPTASNNDDSAQADNGHQSRGHAMPRSTFEQCISGLASGREANDSGIGQQEALTSARGQANTSRNGNMQGELSDIEYQGLYFSNIVRQLMPYISQGTTTESG